MRPIRKCGVMTAPVNLARGLFLRTWHNAAPANPAKWPLPAYLAKYHSCRGDRRSPARTPKKSFANTRAATYWATLNNRSQTRFFTRTATCRATLNNRSQTRFFTRTATYRATLNNRSQTRFFTRTATCWATLNTRSQTRFFTRTGRPPVAPTSGIVPISMMP